MKSDQYLPPIDQVVKATAEMNRVGIKLSPMISEDELEPFHGRTEFISHGRECKEALLWLGTGVVPGREAIHVESGSRLLASESVEIAWHAARFVFEANPAAIRAHALGTLGRELGLAELRDSNGFLTGTHEASSPWLRRFETILELPFDKKTLKRELAARGLSADAVKNRGIRLDANALALELRSPGSEQVVVLIYPSSGGVKAVIAQEIHP